MMLTRELTKSIHLQINNKINHWNCSEIGTFISSASSSRQILSMFLRTRCRFCFARTSGTLTQWVAWGRVTPRWDSCWPACVTSASGRSTQTWATLLTAGALNPFSYTIQCGIEKTKWYPVGHFTDVSRTISSSSPSCVPLFRGERVDYSLCVDI